MTYQSLLTLSNIMIGAAAVFAALGTFGNFYYREQIDQERRQVEEQRAAATEKKERDAQRTLAEQQKFQAAATLVEAEQLRRSKVLSKLRKLYILSHDGISSELIAGTAPIPKAWAERQLQQLGETWRQSVYY